MCNFIFLLRNIDKLFSVHCTSDKSFLDLPLKGTHARDFHSLFIKFVLHLSVTYRYKNAVQPTFSKIFLKFTQIFKVFEHSPLLPKAPSMAERCCRKRGVKFSAVFVTVRFQVNFSVFSGKAKSNFAFSAKAWS